MDFLGGRDVDFLDADRSEAAIQRREIVSFVALQRSFARARRPRYSAKTFCCASVGAASAPSTSVASEVNSSAIVPIFGAASPFPSRNGESFFSNASIAPFAFAAASFLCKRFELLVHGIDLAIRLPRLRKLAFDIAIKRKRLLQLRARRVDARIGRDRQRLMRFLAIDDQRNVVIARQRQRTFRRQRRVLAPHGRDRIVVFDRLRPRPAQVPDEAVRAGFG